MTLLTLNQSSRLFNLCKKYSNLRVDKLGSQLVEFYSTVISQNPVSGQTCSHQKPPKMYGQPTPLTHPHLLSPGELVPGIKLEEFKERRKTLVKHIVETGKISSHPHIIIIPSATKVYMSDKIPYFFRQNTDFLYFTGCQEPDSILLIVVNGEKYESTLFVQKKDLKSELWDGPRTGAEAAIDMFGVDRSLPISDFEFFISSIISEDKNSTFWYENNEQIHPEFHKKILQLVKSTGLRSVTSPQTIFHNIRLIKSPAEIQLMKKSCDIASAAITKTIEVSKPGMSEHELFAIVDYECRMNGAEHLAYPPVVAGGKNANIIHYIKNNQIVNRKEMVLMDAGCEYHGYSSDITRTWPIDGTFTPQQRILYEIVLEVQKSLIKKVEEFITLDQIFYEMCRLLGKRLQEIGLIPKDFSSEKAVSAAYSYCPHHVSHYLGMDVHDVGKVTRSLQTKPGMIITVEPGIYVNPKNELALPEFYNLGIRIEDDVLIGESGSIVLTKNCPKEIEQIESLAKLNQL
ncbi:xaa-Pro aminopeptidase 3-like [Chelonus insularis]|uniref:xaa-Pro aminopeptidase 3-like n=1 Tax=Chelonus insularis TaxID=460826 RepID=UPI00158F4843|nr:xaa-Pro aminopeptidase 3-like [Chelonus insularis]